MLTNWNETYSPKFQDNETYPYSKAKIVRTKTTQKEEENP